MANMTTSCRCRRLFDAHANSCPSRRWCAIRMVHAALVEMLQAMLIGERGYKGAAGSGVLGVRGSATTSFSATGRLPGLGQVHPLSCVDSRVLGDGRGRGSRCRQGQVR